MKLIVNTNSQKSISSVSGIQQNMYPYEVGYKDDYWTNVEVYVYDDTGTYNKTDNTETLLVTLRDAYPTNIGDVTLNWADNTNYMRFPIAFTYFDTFEKNEYQNTKN